MTSLMTYLIFGFLNAKSISFNPNNEKKDFEKISAMVSI